MVIVIESQERVVMLQGHAARRLLLAEQSQPAGSGGPAPRDEAEAHARVAAEFYDVV